MTGLMGVSPGAFLWSASPWFVALKMQLASWLINEGLLWPLQTRLRWWLLTDYPARNDIMTLLDGATLLIFIAGAAVLLTALIGSPFLLAARPLRPLRGAGRLHHLVLALLPLTDAGAILVLFAQTVTLLHHDGLALNWIAEARAALLVLASGWSLLLLWQLAGRHATGQRRSASALAGAGGILAGITPWLLLFWLW